MKDDYFSFMSRKGNPNCEKQLPLVTAKPSVLPSDTIDFVVDTQMEVTESFVSDTAIQRMFKRAASG